MLRYIRLRKTMTGRKFSCLQGMKKTWICGKKIFSISESVLGTSSDVKERQTRKSQPLSLLNESLDTALDNPTEN